MDYPDLGSGTHSTRGRLAASTLTDPIMKEHPCCSPPAPSTWTRSIWSPLCCAAQWGSSPPKPRYCCSPNAGHWLPALAAADLIHVETDDDDTAPPTGHVPDIAWAAITWTDLEAALADGRIEGSSDQLRILRAAASIADGQPVDLGDIATGLDRRHLQLLLAALSHAGGSHEHGNIDAVGHRGDSPPPLVRWPARD